MLTKSEGTDPNRPTRSEWAAGRCAGPIRSLPQLDTSDVITLTADQVFVIVRKK